MKLKSNRHEQFCQEYIIDFNGTRAATDAGFSKRSAKVTASRLLTKANIQQRISELLKDRSERTRITQDMVLHELKILGCSDIRDYLEITKEFNTAKGILLLPEGRLRLKMFKEMKGDATRAIKSISEHITKDGIQLKFKLHGKTPALELLGKHLGTFTDINIKGKFKHEYILSMKDFKESNKKMKKEGASGP